MYLLRGGLNLGFNYELLMEDVCDLEQFWQDNKVVFRGLENNFKEHYKAKYISLLFDFYHELYEFSSIYSDKFDTNIEEDMKILLKHFEKFTSSYAKLIQFFEFAEAECPYHIFSVFDRWKNKRLDLIESLEQINDTIYWKWRGLIISGIKRFSKEDFNNDEIIIDFKKEFTFDELITTNCRFLIFDEENKNIFSNFKIIDSYRILITEKPFIGYVEYFKRQD